MGFLLLRPQDLKGLISMNDAINAVEKGYRGITEYPVINAPRRRVHSPTGVRVSNFPGGVHSLGVIGAGVRADLVRQLDSNQIIPYREHPIHVLHDSNSGHLLAILIGEVNEKTLGYTSVMALGQRRLAAWDSATWRERMRRKLVCSVLQARRPISFSPLNASGP